MTVEELVATTVIDLTTTGRLSGQPRRIEIWWFHVNGRFVITGTPGPRDWFANVLADRRITIHVAGHDILATATPITDPTQRRSVLTSPQTSWYTTQAELDELVADAPMVEVTLS